MEQLQRVRIDRSPGRLSQLVQRLYPIFLIASAAWLLVLVIRAKVLGTEIPHSLTATVAVAFFVATFVGTFFLVRALREYRESQERFQQMATNIREIFWMIDVQSKRVLYVNDAYEAITGRSCQSLFQNPTSYQELIPADDRDRVVGRLDEATRTGQFNERFRIVCAHGEVRWVHVRGFPVRTAAGRVFRLVGTAQEITEQKLAEDEVAKNLRIAEEARAEAEALRKATLALTQDLHMDFVMEALLRSLEELIPYSCARVIVPEGGPHALALGERQIPEPPKTSPKYHPGYPLTLSADESPFLKRILEGRKGFLIPDTKKEEEWRSFKGHSHLRSWLSVPLLASGKYLGFLSIGHIDPNCYTAEHLRRAELLSIPAAAAIQNARLFDRADMYASELEKRLVDLCEAQDALKQAGGGRRVPDDMFQKVFRSSPIPFSITSLSEGRFIDVNTAFERRYGYLRHEVLGHTVHELRMWAEPADRMFMIEQLRRGMQIRNVITRIRTKSGDLKLTAYSADRIHFNGEACILAVSEDLPEFDKKKTN
jgi:PAS domain S-box-containing protein